MRNNPHVESILVDTRNYPEIAPEIIAKMQSARIIGFDIETSNRNAHPGILKLESKKVIFDIHRTIVTGFSLYVEGDSKAYYFNLNHDDFEFSLKWEKVKVILDAKPDNANWIVHNGPFEITMMRTCYGYELKGVLCSLQLCVTAYNSDTYPMDKFMTPDIGELRRKMPTIMRAFATYSPGMPMTPEQEDLIAKYVAKESEAADSYNGYVDSISYGFGLKKAIKSWFNFQMTEYKELLKHYNVQRMDELTGEQVVEYGCDDAYWCVKLFLRVLQWLTNENPEAVATYFNQENPMIYQYADLYVRGWKVDFEAIREKQGELRERYAQLMREMKEALQGCLPFPSEPSEPHEKLMKYDEWFAKNWQKYRKQVVDFCKAPEEDDTYTMLQQGRSSISNQWAQERNKPESKAINLIHYMPMRTILYDLCQLSYQQTAGKTDSDAETRGEMMKRYAKVYSTSHNVKLETVLDVEKLKPIDPVFAAAPTTKVLVAYQEMAGIEQAMKLYINAYMYLTDPETSKMYPLLSSMLDTRRLSCSNPNGQQLSNNGASRFVRKFFLADNEDHVFVSVDFSAIELVILAEFSKDPEFFLAYGQRPHQDIHSRTAANMKAMALEDFLELPDTKELRTNVGKKSNFGYWYSGALGNTAKAMGWTSEEHWAMVEKYRETYEVAEQWRVSMINEVNYKGFVTLPDHLRRYRFEATSTWAEMMRAKFAPYDVPGFTEMVIKKIQRRAGNQAVNAQIQGTCGTLTKKKMIQSAQMILDKGYDGRMVLSVHDELLFSIHKDHVLDFLDDLYDLMIGGEGIINHVKIDSSIGIGLNFLGFDKDKNPKGLIELMELDKGLPCVSPDRWKKKATTDERKAVLDYLFSKETEVA